MEERLIVSVRLMRREGVEVPRHFHSMGSGHRGYLSLGEEFRPDLRRHCRVAKLDPLPVNGEKPTGLSPLWDAQMIYMTAYSWVLNGTERADDGMTVREFSQSWWVFPVAVAVPEATP